MDLKDLYRDVIVDHNRARRNFRKIADATRMLEGFNPLCGDKLTVYLKMDGELIQRLELRRHRLRHLRGLRFTHERTAQRQDPYGSRELFGRMHDPAHPCEMPTEIRNPWANSPPYPVCVNIHPA